MGLDQEDRREVDRRGEAITLAQGRKNFEGSWAKQHRANGPWRTTKPPQGRFRRKREGKACHSRSPQKAYSGRKTETLLRSDLCEKGKKRGKIKCKKENDAAEKKIDIQER